MADETTIQTVLETAIRLEIKSEEVYRRGAGMVTTPGARALLNDLADEELRHQEMLRGVEASGDHQKIGAGRAPQDLKVTDYLEGPGLKVDSSTEDILIFAAKREQAAIDLYTRMLEIYRGTGAQPILERLILEEGQHKSRIEQEYDDVVLHDN